MPHVTVVMFTQPARRARLLRTLRNFHEQTLRPVKLFIFTPDISGLVNDITPPGTEVEIGVFPATPAEALAQIVTRLQQSGDYLALWDDDDLYRPDRLVKQIALVDAVAAPSFLSASIWHFSDSREVFIMDLDKRYDPLPTRLHFSSLLCRSQDVSHLSKLRLKPGVSPSSQIGLHILQKYHDAVRPAGEWPLMVKGIDGDNVQGYETLRGRLRDTSRCKGRQWLEENREAVLLQLQKYYWEEGELSVCGHDGEAFTFTPAQCWQGLPPLPAPTIELGSA